MTYYTWHMTHDIWHMTYDTWHMTHDIWHMTHDTWHMTQDICHMTHDIWHMTYDTWHMTHDIWHMTYKLPLLQNAFNNNINISEVNFSLWNLYLLSFILTISLSIGPIVFSTIFVVWWIYSLFLILPSFYAFNFLLLYAFSKPVYLTCNCIASAHSPSFSHSSTIFFTITW